MSRNVTICNNCAGSVVLSLGEHTEHNGLVFCSEQCAEHYFSPENAGDRYPVGLAHDLGLDEGGY